MAKLDDLLCAEAFDLPGHGKSPDWEGARDLLLSSAEIAAGLDGPLDVIGHSFGAVVALRLALSHPLRIRSLTLIEPVLFAAARGTAAYEAQKAMAVPFADMIARGEREAAAQAFTDLWGTGLRWEDIPDATRAYFTARIHLIPATDAALFDDASGLLAGAQLEGFKAPVLLIKGQNSPPVIAAIQATLAARLPNAQRVTIKGAGHMAPITHVRETASVIRAFLGGVSP